MLAYGLVWDGIRIPLGRAVRDGADRVEEPEDRVPLGPRGVAPRRADASGGGRGGRGGRGSRGRSGARRVGATRASPWRGPSRPGGGEIGPFGGSRWDWQGRAAGAGGNTA